MSIQDIIFDYTEKELNDIKREFSQQIDIVSKSKEIPYANTLKERIEMRNKYMKEGKSYEEIELLIYEKYKFKKNSFYHLVRDVRITLLYFLYKLNINSKCSLCSWYFIIRII